MAPCWTQRLQRCFVDHLRDTLLGALAEACGSFLAQHHSREFLSVLTTDVSRIEAGVWAAGREWAALVYSHSPCARNTTQATRLGQVTGLQEFDQRRHGANLGEHEGDEPHQQGITAALDLGLDLAAQLLDLSPDFAA